MKKRRSPDGSIQALIATSPLPSGIVPLLSGMGESQVTSYGEGCDCGSAARAEPLHHAVNKTRVQRHRNIGNRPFTVSSPCDIHE